MIDTRTRDPEQTWRDVQELVEWAQREGFVPLSWRLGFFCARDLLAQHMKGWKERRAEHNNWIALIQLCGLPAVVVELEDRIQLLAAAQDRNLNVDLAASKVFIVDRRATGG